MPVSLTSMVRDVGRASGPPKDASPIPLAPPRCLQRVTILLYPEDIQRAEALWAEQGFTSRHHLLQWLLLHGLKAMEAGALKPERRLSRIVEVQAP